ncbi:hypothetical protein EYR40_000588 [Pleurotus pulmonarius]|nr:hypothetical protein EYR36_004327 [Pleurotus pulmonarius]KAF4603421.1 hypothetical protein EYR38_003834 [Pleurotus pulmonarius]KAF4608244.1 hypothetical protein EYR40_000588 [Pleurotus pulmonarius]
MSCVTTPSATETLLVTLTSQSVSNSPSVTTMPDSTSTTIFTTCALTGTASDSSAPGPTCLVTRTVTSTAVIPGGEVTTQVPFTVDVPFTSTSFSTLFGTSCTSRPVSDPPTPQPPTTAPPTPPTSISISTPPPETFTSQSESTLPNGVVTTTLLTVVSTLPPTSIVVSTTMPGQSQQQDNNNDNSTNLGPIIGGTVGGFFGLIGIVAVVWFIMKRRSRWDDIFDKEEDTMQETTRASGNRFSLDVDNEPKPYQYGLVGHVTSPQLHSPPNSPPFGPVVGGSVHNRRTSSTGIPAPLSLSPSFTTSAGHSAQNTATNMTALSSRPSSAGSMQPLFTAGQQQGRMTNEFGTRPPSIHSHSHSSSITSPPTTFANWGNNVNITGTGSFMGPAAAGGVAAVAAMAVDEPRRSGSPVSINDPPRRLQLVNATPASAASSIYSPDNEHRRGLSNDSIMSNNRAGPSSHANVAEFDPYASTSIDTPLAQGVTRTNTKGMVILDPPSREVRVATDGGRVAVAGGSSSAAGPSSSNQAASSSSSSAPPPKAQPQQEPSNPPPAYEE